MQTSDNGIIALLGHEGVVPGPYFDSKKVLTYGVGHTKAAGFPDPGTLPVGMPDNMDAALMDVFRVFRKDLAKYEADVNRAIKVPVSQHEFDAAVSFHYNTGAIHRASWVKALNKGDRAKAAAQIMNWTKPAEIIPRRQSEHDLFARGEYPNSRINVWRVGTNRQVIWKIERTLTGQEALALLRGQKAPDAPPASEIPPQTGGKRTVGIGAALAAIAALVAAFACKLPFISNMCGG